MFPEALRVPVWENNGHLKKIEEFFGEMSAKFIDDLDVDRFVFVCYTNRSGSNYLSEVIASDGQLPVAGENLNWDVVVQHAEREGIQSFQEYFKYLSRLTGREGSVAIKAAPQHLEILARSGVLRAVLERSHFIIVERADKLAQAISHAIAFQTGKFTSLIEGNDSEPAFDRAQLEQIIKGIARAHNYFNEFFALNGIVPAVVNYEQFCADPERHVKFIGEHLGLESLSVNSSALRLEKQSGGRNVEWRAEFLK